MLQASSGIGLVSESCAGWYEPSVSLYTASDPQPDIEDQVKSAKDMPYAWIDVSKYASPQIARYVTKLIDSHIIIGRPPSTNEDWDLLEEYARS